MNIRSIKFTVTAFFGIGVVVLLGLGEAPNKTAAATAFDAAAVYKAKCAMCHTPKADKFFDAAKADADLVQIVLKGKKGEKPPFMPGYEEKGMTADEATGLVQYMKSLKTAQ